jgi:hypothetical protein
VHADEQAWVATYVDPVGAVETVHDRPWATVTRVPTSDGDVWFKACSPLQAFEPRLSAELFERWPDRVGEVLAHDDDRAWLLLGDAGRPVGTIGNPPESWEQVLPGYAELQRGETEHAEEHERHGVPSLRLAALPGRFDDLLRTSLPLTADETTRLRRCAGLYADLCAELTARGPAETVQHDDLHMANLFKRGRRLRILDWGDTSISHPFASLVVTFRFLEERNGMSPADPWFGRLRDAYLEPWGPDLRGTFDLAIRVGAVAHAVAWRRQRDALGPMAGPDFDTGFATVLRRALAQLAAEGG